MTNRALTGNIFIFHAFDVGEEISFERVKQDKLIQLRSSAASKYFKNYHIPLTVSLSSQANHKNFTNAKVQMTVGLPGPRLGSLALIKLTER